MVDNERSYTYQLMDELSNRLANYLIGQGIQPEDVVTLYAHRSVSIVVGIMGILKAGATFSVIGMSHIYMFLNIHLFALTQCRPSSFFGRSGYDLRYYWIQ